MVLMMQNKSSRLLESANKCKVDLGLCECVCVCVCVLFFVLFCFVFFLSPLQLLK